LAAVESAVKIHCEESSPIGREHFLERAADLTHDSSCVVHEDVDTAACFECPGNHDKHGRTIAHVEQVSLKRRFLFRR
jgi:hypothetical protein